jgi:adenylate cyclase
MTSREVKELEDDRFIEPSLVHRGSDASRDDVVGALRALLASHGVSAAEFEEALHDDRLDLLVADRLVLPGEALSGQQVSERAGIPLELAGRLWRALGFPEASEEASFNEDDVDALRTIEGLAEIGATGEDTAVQVTRVIGQSMARIADTLVAAADGARSAKRPEWATDPDDEGILVAESIAFSSEIIFPSIEKLVVHAWRRHIQAAVRRRASMRRDGSHDGAMVTYLTVGFADMVGFTALSSQLTAEALAKVVDRFEELAHTTVVEGGGRPVKMIGDEVMYVASSPHDAVRIALDLADVYADDDLLSDVRVGLAAGPSLMREGDFFGSVVNRAHRIVSIADAGTVLCGEEVHDAVATSASELYWEPLKPRELKDIGRVSLWQVRRDVVGTPEERRSGIRWRRLSEPLASAAGQAAKILPQHSAS